MNDSTPGQLPQTSFSADKWIERSRRDEDSGTAVEEKNCLVQLVSERVNVVESKRNNFETVSHKSSAWEEISKKFHAQMMILYFLRMGPNVYLSPKSWDWRLSNCQTTWVTPTTPTATNKVLEGILLTTSFSNCAFVDLSSSYCTYSDLFLCDGLHLNFFGKQIFAEEVKSAIIKCIYVRRSSCANKYIPAELKKLLSPLPPPTKSSKESFEEACWRHLRTKSSQTNISMEDMLQH